MHITVHCPTCRSRYQVESNLRGQPMRCPNPVCREIFVVEGNGDEPSAPAPKAEERIEPFRLEAFGSEPTEVERPAPPSEKGKVSGSVGDLIPILDAEVVGQAPPTAKVRSKPPQTEKAPAARPTEKMVMPPDGPPVVTSWREPPPVRNPQARADTVPAPVEPPPPPPPVEKKKLPAARKTQIEEPVASAPVKESEPAPEWQLPPPVRRPGMEGSPASPLEQVFAPEGTGSAQELDLSSAPTTTRGKRALWIIGGMVAAASILIGTLVVVGLNLIWNKENNLFHQAMSEFEQGRFGTAAGDFQELMKEFPQSPSLPQYRFMAEFSQLRDGVQNVSDPRDIYGRLRRFLDEYNDDVFLKPHRGDVGSDLRQLAQQLTTLADERGDRGILLQARTALNDSSKYQEGQDLAGIEAQMADVEAAIEKRELRQQFIVQLKDWAARANLEILKEARTRARHLGLEQDQEITDLIHGLDVKVTSKVRYVSDRLPPEPGGPGTSESSLVVAPPLAAPEQAGAENSRVVLALARGVLYAFRQSDGALQWVSRVGIDTTALPIRLPRTSTASEMFLVLSADRNNIMALTADKGQLVWQHHLSAPSLGRPVIVGSKVYVATFDGKVYEIEIYEGSVLGHFELGQHLTVGGARQEGTNLLYFPGDSDNLYVLEIPTNPNDHPRCKVILHTGHPAGSLRSEPIIINRSDPSANATEESYLVLSQSDGLNDMKLRVYGLPLVADSPILQPEPSIRGWSWFQPYHDHEKLAFMTDQGYLGIYGINQPKDVDPPLFPMFREEKPLGDPATRLGRGQVIYAASENQFYVLANGELKRLYLRTFYEQITTDWTAWLKKGENAYLGWPLHAGQFDENSKVLFVVTHDPRRQVQLATAVDAETGKILWQRQLGMECQDDPVVLGHEVVAADRSGGLFAFQPGKASKLFHRHWQLADAFVSGPLEGDPVDSYFFPMADGSIYQLASPRKGRLLTLRHYQLGPDGQKQVTEKVVALNNAWLQGTPALLGGPTAESLALLLPLGPDGIIQRFNLSGDRSGGPTWRGPRADDDAPGHVVRIDADDFLITDGSRGISHWQWRLNDPQAFHRVPAGAEKVEMHARIVSAPVVLPAVNQNARLEVCVADADGTVTLLQGDGLKPVRSWPLGGKITAGPFLRGQYIGCVVNRRRLVWIDPAKVTDGADADHQKAQWEYEAAADIVGEPQLIKGMIVVVDLSGRMVALRPDKGEKLNDGYVLKASAAPAATAAAFGQNEALLPLTDGTVFVLPLYLIGAAPPMPFLL